MIIGNQVLILNDREIKDFAEGTIISLAPGGDIVTRLISKDRRVSYARNVENTGYTLTIRLLRGSSDEIYFSGLYKNIVENKQFAKTKLLNGTLDQEIGDGNGGVSTESWNLEGGMVSTRSEISFNVSGDNEQKVVVFTILVTATKSNK